MTAVLRVCLIDDNLSVREILALGLCDAGHEVTEAGDGASGLDAIGRSRPDVVVTDLTLPDMKGAEIVQAIRRAHASLPIVAISGGSSGGESTAAELGADAYLSKPFRMKELAAAMAEAMARHAR